MNIGGNMFSQYRHNGTKTTPALIALSLLLSSLLIFNPVAQAEDISDETYNISMEDNYYDYEGSTDITILLTLQYRRLRMGIRAGGVESLTGLQP